MSPRDQYTTSVVDTFVPELASPVVELTLASLPSMLDHAIASGSNQEAVELARAFPGAYAFFYSVACDAEVAGAFEDADRAFLRATVLLQNTEDRLPGEDELLASLI